MRSDDRARSVRRCAWGYAAISVGAGLAALAVGLVANATWASGDDTGGLGAMLGTFFIAAGLGNVAWAIAAFEVLASHGRSVRSLSVAVGTPLIVIAAWIFARPMLGAASALLLPAPSAWWATSPRPST